MCATHRKSHACSHVILIFTFMHGNTVKSSLHCKMCLFRGWYVCITVYCIFTSQDSCVSGRVVFLYVTQSFSVYLQVFLSGKQKNAAAIATESKGRPGPGLSPLEHPDWSRPAVWALLPCGRRGRQFSERCRGRRAISAVLSGWIYTAGFFFPHSCDIFCGWIKSLSVNAHINFTMKWGEDLLTLLLIDKGNVRQPLKAGNKLTPCYFFFSYRVMKMSAVTLE